MIDHDNLEEFRDPQTYDLEDKGYYDDYPLTEQWAQQEPLTATSPCITYVCQRRA